MVTEPDVMIERDLVERPNFSSCLKDVGKKLRNTKEFTQKP